MLSWAQAAMHTRFTVGDSIFGTTQPTATVSAVEQFLLRAALPDAGALDFLHSKPAPSPQQQHRVEIQPAALGCASASTQADVSTRPADLDKWDLSALDSLGGACRSLLLAAAVVKAGGLCALLSLGCAAAAAHLPVPWMGRHRSHVHRQSAHVRQGRWCRAASRWRRPCG